MIESFFVIEIGLILLVLAISIFFIQFLLVPYMKLLFYKKQGAQVEFHPFASEFPDNYALLKSTRDFWSEHKLFFKKNPSMKCFASNMGRHVILFPIESSIIREFYNKQDFYVKAPIFLKSTHDLVGDGLFVIDGDIWRKHRRVISSVFNFEYLKSNIQNIIHNVRELFDEMELHSLERVNIMDEFQTITGEVVSRIFFGKSMGDQKLDNKSIPLYLASLMYDDSEMIKSRLGTFFGQNLMSWSPNARRMRQRMQKIRNICIQVVLNRKELRKQTQKSDLNEVTGHRDLLDSLLEYQEKNGADALTDKEIIDEYVSFFFAGMDTTGHLTTLLAYNLHQNPQILAKVREEVQQNYKGKSEGEISFDEINSMELLQATIKETLRYSPPATRTLIRQSLKDHKLGSIDVKKGSFVAVEMVAVHYNQKNFEDPEKFNPYRWMDKDAQSKLDPFAFLPFSAGAHNCIGQHLSMLEAKIIMSEFLLRYDFKVSEGYVHRMTQRLLYEPDEPLVLDLKRI